MPGKDARKQHNNGTETDDGEEVDEFGENNLLNYNFNNNEAQEAQNLGGPFPIEAMRPQNSKGTSRFVKTGGVATNPMSDHETYGAHRASNPTNDVSSQ